MKSGYEEFFEAAKRAKSDAPQKSVARKKTESSQEERLKSALIRARSKQKATKKSTLIPWVPLCLAGMILTGFGWYVMEPKQVMQLIRKVEIRWLSPLAAQTATEDKKNSMQDSAKDGEKIDPSKVEPGEKSADSTSAKAAQRSRPFNAEEISHLKKLNERKEQLDQREKALNELETELQEQKKEIEARILELQKVRRDIATVLEDRVNVDQDKVNRLVDFYSNMKPKQAAGILEKINEDLAVEVLGKMKKKNAAEIMNLLKPEKARSLSEKFTGYKRR